LRECIDRTDPARGQSPTWRAEKCPLDEEAAKSELEQLLEEVKERAKEALASKKADPDKTLKDTEGSVKDASGTADGAGGKKSAAAAPSFGPSGLSLSGLLGGGGPSLAAIREWGALPGLCQVVGPPSLDQPSASTLGAFTGPLPTLGSGSGAGLDLAPPTSTGVVCDLPSLSLSGFVPRSQTSGFDPEAPLLDIQKVAEDTDGNAISGVVPGQLFWYRITLTNNTDAPVDAFFEDDIPSELTFVEFSDEDELICLWDGDILQCEAVGLAAGESVAIIVSVLLSSEHCDQEVPASVIGNTAIASFFIEGELVPVDASTVLVGVDCVGLLAVTKTAVPVLDSDIQSGTEFLYNITLTNNAGETAVGRIEDDLPDEVTPLLLLASDDWDCSASVGDVLNCTTELDPGQTRGLSVVMVVPEDFCSESDESIVINTVQSFILVEGLGEVPSGLAIETTTVPCSDVHIDKTLEGPEPIFPGDEITFVLTVSNSAKSEQDTIGRATGVVVTDQIPGGFQVLGPLPGGCTVDEGNLLTCDIGWLEVDEELVLEIPVRVITGECGEFLNTADISTLNEWPLHSGPRDNSSTVEFFVECVPNITITKTADAVGRTITYTITAANTGTETATAVQVKDNLDNDLNQVEASASDGTCVVGSGNNVVCQLGDIPEDGSETVTITARAGVAACPSVVNEAEGTATNEPESAQGDNSDRVRITVDCVLGSTTTRDGVVLGSLAATGLGLLPLLLLAGVLLAAGEMARRAGRKSRRETADRS
ncbi:MAG TPA: DUF11 domain-containing protein, partial [Longimicrobiales bacterium]